MFVVGAIYHQVRQVQSGGNWAAFSRNAIRVISTSSNDDTLRINQGQHSKPI